MLGFSEIFLIVVLASMLLGPERLPQLIRQFAKTVAAWRAELDGAREEAEEALGVETLQEELAQVRRELAEIRSLPQTLAADVERAVSASPADSEAAREPVSNAPAPAVENTAEDVAPPQEAASQEARRMS